MSGLQERVHRCQQIRVGERHGIIDEREQRREGQRRGLSAHQSVRDGLRWQRHRFSSVKTVDHRSRPLRLHRNDARRGLQCLHRGSAAARERPAAHRNEHRADRLKTARHLETNCSGAFDDIEALAIVDEEMASLPSKLDGDRFGCVEVLPDLLDGGAERLDHRLLHRVRCNRQKHVGVQPEQSRCVGDALSVISGGRGHNRPFTSGSSPPASSQQSCQGASQLE